MCERNVKQTLFSNIDLRLLLNSNEYNKMYQIYSQRKSFYKNETKLRGLLSVRDLDMQSIGTCQSADPEDIVHRTPHLMLDEKYFRYIV